MSTDSAANLWWRSVLENGPSSPFANCFDIDWEPVKIDLKNKVLLPVLGDQYGVTLESGQLQIAFDKGAFHLRHFDLDLPLNPSQLRGLLSYDLESLVAKFGRRILSSRNSKAFCFIWRIFPPIRKRIAKW